MKIVLTVVLAAIFLAAVWGGYRRGLILSAAQLAAIVVALYGAALLAGLFSDRLLPVAEPFAGGYFEGQLDVVATELPDNDAGLSGEDWVAAHPDTAQEYAEQCFAAAGVTGRPARRMASAALAMRDEQDITLRAAMTQVYCARLCYVLVTSVGFLLILLILAAIGNLPNLAFQLPNREKLNDIGGAAFGAAPETAAAVTRAVRAVTKKPIIMKLSPAAADIAAVAKACEEAGANGVSLINTLPGMRIDLKRRRPLLANGTGGMSGPGIFPLAVRMVYQVYEAVRIPIVGMGGVSCAEDVVELMLAGATAVGVGAANLVDPYACKSIIEALPSTLAAYGIQDIKDIIGGAHHG